MTDLADKLEALINSLARPSNLRLLGYDATAELVGMMPIIIRALRERDQAVEALRELQEQLAKAQSPQWFYHPEYTDICEFGPWEVIESYDLKPGKHVVEIQTARPLPSIWSVVHVLTNAEKDEMETDDAWMVQDFTTEAEARAALAAIEGAEQ